MPPWASGFVAPACGGEDDDYSSYSNWVPVEEFGVGNAALAESESVEDDAASGSAESESADEEEKETTTTTSVEHTTLANSPSKGGRKRSYALLDSQISQALQRELDGMKEYLSAEKSTSGSRERMKGEKTVHKYIERVRGYLGWYLNISDRLTLGTKLSMELLLDEEAILEFAYDFQRKERGNSAATVVQFFIAISSAVKYVLEILKKDSNFESNSVYRMCAARRREQDREATKHRKTEANLRLAPDDGGKGRITWEIFLNLTLELLEDYRDLCSRCEPGQHRVLMNLIFCLLTAALLPGRGQECRLLQVLESRPENSWQGNGLYPKNGTYIFRWGIFKNVGDVGSTETELPADFPEILPLLKKYLLRSLPCLSFRQRNSNDPKYLFLDSNGNPFQTAAAWTTYLNRFFESRLDIAGISNTALRRAVIEEFSTGLTPLAERASLSSSLASAMKHTTRQQEKYNQLTSIEKSRVAQNYSKDLFLNAAKSAEVEVDDDDVCFADAAGAVIEEERSRGRKQIRTESPVPTPCIQIARELVGKVVAVVFDHLHGKPIYFAVVLAVTETKENDQPEICGRYLERAKQKSKYFELSDEVLQEPIRFCHRIEFEYSIKHHAYTFKQDERVIKKAILSKT